MNLGFRVYCQVPRSRQEVVAQFRNAAVANLADAMHGKGVVDCGIRPIYLPMRRIVATAITVDLTPGDGLLLRKAIELAQAGDVIVANAHGCTERATFGGNVCISAAQKQLAGIIVDGAVRDAAEAQGLDFPVMARSLNARSGTSEAGWGEVNVPVACGGVVVNPGDIVVGDGEGIVVIPGDFAEDVLEGLKAIEGKKGRPEELAQRASAVQQDPARFADKRANKALAERGATIVDGPYQWWSNR